MRKMLFILLMTIIGTFLLSAELPDYPIVFPDDDFGHQDNPLNYPLGMFAEWWYFNGEINGISIRTGKKRNLGFFISFHLHKIPGMPNDLKLVLSAVTDLDNDLYNFTYMGNHEEYFTKDTVRTDKLYVDYEGAVSGGMAKLMGLYTFPGKPGQSAMKINSSLMTDSGDVMKLNLVLIPRNNPLLLNGGKIDMPGLKTFNSDSGFVLPNGESFYIAKTKLLIAGMVNIGDEMVFVNTARSEAWFDHQYGDFLDSDNHGWEWFSVRLAAGKSRRYNLYGDIFGFVDKDTKELLYGYGGFLLPGGKEEHMTFDSSLCWVQSDFLEAGDYSFPLKHNIDFPKLGLSLEIESSVAAQYDYNMYEGHCDVKAVYNGKNIKGFAYKELTY